MSEEDEAFQLNTEVPMTSQINHIAKKKFKHSYKKDRSQILYDIDSEKTPNGKKVDEIVEDEDDDDVYFEELPSRLVSEVRSLRHRRYYKPKIILF